MGEERKHSHKEKSTWAVFNVIYTISQHKIVSHKIKIRKALSLRVYWYHQDFRTTLSSLGIFSDAIIVRKTSILEIKPAADFIPDTMLNAFPMFLPNHGHSPRRWVDVVITFS